jgi:transcription termination factor Rho
MHLSGLRDKDIEELTKMAEEAQIENAAGLKKHELIFCSPHKTRQKKTLKFLVTESLEILPDGFRIPCVHLHTTTFQVPMIFTSSPSQIRRFGLKNW